MKIEEGAVAGGIEQVLSKVTTAMSLSDLLPLRLVSRKWNEVVASEMRERNLKGQIFEAHGDKLAEYSGRLPSVDSPFTKFMLGFYRDDELSPVGSDFDQNILAFLQVSAASMKKLIVWHEGRDEEESPRDVKKAKKTNGNAAFNNKTWAALSKEDWPDMPSLETLDVTCDGDEGGLTKDDSHDKELKEFLKAVLKRSPNITTFWFSTPSVPEEWANELLELLPNTVVDLRLEMRSPSPCSAGALVPLGDRLKLKCLNVDWRDNCEMGMWMIHTAVLIISQRQTLEKLETELFPIQFGDDNYPHLKQLKIPNVGGSWFCFDQFPVLEEITVGDFLLLGFDLDEDLPPCHTIKKITFPEMAIMKFPPPGYTPITPPLLKKFVEACPSVENVVVETDEEHFSSTVNAILRSLKHVANTELTTSLGEEIGDFTKPLKQLRTLLLKTSKDKMTVFKQLDEMIERLNEQNLEDDDRLYLQFAKGKLMDMEYTKPSYD